MLFGQSYAIMLYLYMFNPSHFQYLSFNKWWMLSPLGFNIVSWLTR